MPLPNFVIAGPPKAGTTSVFRYLASHPDVAPSSIKEIHFFERYLDNINSETLAKYAEYFSSASGEKILLEASPRYMQCGTPVAKALHDTLPTARVAFILREPVDRFLSRYISLVTKTERIADEHRDLDALVDAALADTQAPVDVSRAAPENEIVEYLWQGAYAPYIAEYLARYPKEQVGIFFFDDLSSDPKKFMQSVCGFLGIDASFYSNYKFSIENKTRTVRFPALHKFAERTNRQLEGLQNRFPAIRRSIKYAYYTFFNRETNAKDAIDTSYASKRLREYYSPYNEELNRIISEYGPGSSIPGWLSEHSGASNNH